MNRYVLLGAIALGCSDAALPPEDCDPPLPSTNDEGEPWPTYTEAEAALAACDNGGGFAWRRGSCSDGKRFIERAGAFTGDTQYFEGQAMVGLRRYADIVVSCDVYRFGDADCEEASAEEVRCD